MSQINYNSPKIWGPSFWMTLRTIAHTYPINPNKDDAMHVKNFFTELQHVLPCEICKYTFKQHFNKHPIEKGLSSRNKLIEWVELIYQETKKVIQDKRIKIMDTPEEEIEEMAPIRTIFKSKNFDPVVARMNEINNKNALPKPPLSQPPKTLQPLKPPKSTPHIQLSPLPQPLAHQPQLAHQQPIFQTLSSHEAKDNSLFDKKNVGKTMTESKPTKIPFVFPQKDKKTELIKQEREKKREKDLDTKSLPPNRNINSKPNFSNPFLNNPNLKPAIKYNPQYQHRMPTNQIISKELVLTRRCKKCDEKELKKAL